MNPSLSHLHALVGSGVEARDLTVVQVGVRAVVIFFAALLIIRVADKRFFAKKTALDVLLALIIGASDLWAYFAAILRKGGATTFAYSSGLNTGNRGF